MKIITREVHLPSVVQSELYEATRIFLYMKKIKIMTFFQQFISSLSLLVTVAPFWIWPIECKQRTLFCIRLNARMRYFHSNQNLNTRGIRLLALRQMQKSESVEVGSQKLELERHLVKLMNEWMMPLYSALLCIVVHPKHFTIMWGGGGGVSPQPPPVCSIHLDDVTAATGQRRQYAHHTPATGGEERES